MHMGVSFHSVPDLVDKIDLVFYQNLKAKSEDPGNLHKFCIMVFLFDFVQVIVK